MGSGVNSNITAATSDVILINGSNTKIYLSGNITAFNHELLCEP